MGLSILLVVSTCCLSALGHEYFPGQCPNFTPMSGFDWAKFSTGVWYVTQKFATKSSCLTYQFKTDDLGFKSIEQVRQLPYSERVGLDHEYIYTGKLYAPQESSPAKMIVRFPLNVVGSSSFTVLDTDYDSQAMVCTCQDFDIIKQEGCEHGKEKVLNIDVDKILGLKGDSGLRDAIESVASEFEFNQKSVDDIKEEAKDII